MLVFWDQRLVFLATPKAGSTAVAAALEPLAAVSMQRPDALKHTDVRQFLTHVAPFLQVAAQGAEFAAVALIRHPTAWLGSWYRQRQRDGADHSTQGISFDTFVQGWCADLPPAFADVGCQSAFLAPGPQGQWLDRLFRYEEIEGLVHYLEERLEFEIILPRLNVSPPGDLALSPQTEALLLRKAARDFALYESLQPA